MFNKYQAGTDLAFSVMVGNERMRIVFDGKSVGCCVYMTRDPKVQKAIESHYWFNDKFFLVESISRASGVNEGAITISRKIGFIPAATSAVSSRFTATIPP